MTRHLLATAAAAALLVTGVAQASSLRGTVVHRNHRAHSFVVANATGRMTAVHATRSPRVGSRVTLKATRLANGTYRAGKVRRHGRAHRARIRGVVTFVDRAHNRFTLSSRGVSLLVRMAHRARVADPSGMPAPGDDVTVTTDLDQSDDSAVVTSTPVQTGQTPAPASQPVDLEGTILAIDTTTRTLTLSADDDNASGQAISVVLPDTFDITAFNVGDELEILATLNPDGTTFTAVSSSGDDNAKQADDQGDDQGNDGPGDDNQGDDGDGDHNQGSGDGQDSGQQQSGDTQSGDSTQSGDTQSGDTSGSGSGSGHGDGGGDGGGDR